MMTEEIDHNGFLRRDADITRHDIIDFLEAALVGPGDVAALSPAGMLDYRYRHLQGQVLAILYKMREPDRKNVLPIDMR